MFPNQLLANSRAMKPLLHNQHHEDQGAYQQVRDKVGEKYKAGLGYKNNPNVEQITNHY